MILKQLRNNFDILNAAMNANKLKGKVDRIILLRSNKKIRKPDALPLSFLSISSRGFLDILSNCMRKKVKK